MKKLRKFREYHIDKLKNAKEARQYLEIALEEYEKDKDIEVFLLALRDVAEAQGGLTTLAERTNLNRQNLYKVLTAKSNPRLDTIETILHGLGFRLSVQPLQK